MALNIFHNPHEGGVIRFDTIPELTSAIEQIILDAPRYGMYYLQKLDAEGIWQDHGYITFVANRKPTKRRFTLERRYYTSNIIAVKLPETKNIYCNSIYVKGVAASLSNTQCGFNFGTLGFQALISALFWTTESGDVVLDEMQGWRNMDASTRDYLCPPPPAPPVKPFDSSGYLSKLFTSKEVSVILKKL